MSTSTRSVFPVSVTMTREEKAQVDARTNGDDQGSRSNRVLGDLNMFWALLDLGMESIHRRFSRGEALLLLDALNGTYIGLDRFDARQTVLTWHSGATLAATVEDALKYEFLDDKWYVDGKALLRKLKKLSPGEIISLLDWTRRVWQKYTAEGPTSSVFEDEVQKILRGERDHGL